MGSRLCKCGHHADDHTYGWGKRGCSRCKDCWRFRGEA